VTAGQSQTLKIFRASIVASRTTFFLMQFRTFLFDLDGTLVDAFTTIHRCYVHTLPQLGLPAPTMTEVRNAVGGGLA